MVDVKFKTEFEMVNLQAVVYACPMTTPTELGWANQLATVKALVINKLVIVTFE